MGERKVLNKYYPPDFDPAKLPRVRRPLNQQIKVRMMLPMSIRCNTCGNYIYKGTKFNSRKEDVAGDTYLGIQIFRFYFKCTRCSAELTIKTDPQNSDYVVEAGAQRNYEPWRNEDELLDREKQKRESEEVGDAMKSLENRTQDSKREMDIMAALDEMKSMKSRHASVSVDAMLQALQRASDDKDKQLELEDEALIKSIIFHNSKDYIRRIEDSDSDDDSDTDNAKRQKVSEWTRIKPTDSLTSAGWTDNSFSSTGKKQDPGAPKKLATNSSTVLVSVKRKQDATSKDNIVPGKSETGIVKSHDDKNVTKVDETKQMSEQKKINDSDNNVLQSLCQAYGDSDDEDEDEDN